MGGKPCIRGMRVTVGMIVEAMSAGRTIEQLLAVCRRAGYSRVSSLRRALQASLLSAGQAPLPPQPSLNRLPQAHQRALRLRRVLVGHQANEERASAKSQ